MIQKYQVHLVWAVIAIVALGGGFAWGKAGGAASLNGASGAAGAYGASTTRRTAGSGSGLVAGQISSIDATSITLQLPNGNSEVVFYASSTQISEPTLVSASKLAVGTNVMVGGTTNSDGSVTAQSIQVRSNGAQP